MHSMQLSTKSFRSKETSPAARLERPRVVRSTLPDQPDAISSLQLQNNLGRGAGRVDQPSKRSLKASFLAQKLDESLSDHRPAPSSKHLPESTPLCLNLTLRRVPGKQAWLQQTFLGDKLWEADAAKQFRKSLPPPSFGNSCFSLEKR